MKKFKDRIEFIYTFKDGEQRKVEREYQLCVFDTKITLCQYAVYDLSEDDVCKLDKISCCVYYSGDTGLLLPDWYYECNGKLYFNDCTLILD